MLKPLVQFIFKVDKRLGLSGFILAEPGLHFLYFLRQEAMVAQRDKLRELSSPQVVGIPCARPRTVNASLLISEELFYFFPQSIVL